MSDVLSALRRLPDGTAGLRGITRTG